LLYSLKQNKHYERFKTKINGQSRFEKLKYFFENEYAIYDFCLLSKNQLRKFYKYAKKIVESSCLSYHPVVLIGHSKNFYFPEIFKNYLDFLLKENVKFRTLSEINEIIRKNN
jgi:hypothetical protein